MHAPFNALIPSISALQKPVALEASDAIGLCNRLSAVSRAHNISQNRNINEDEVRDRELLNKARHDLAFNIFCGWLAYRLGVTLPTAKRHAEQAGSPLGSMWFHLAEDAEKLHAGYIPVDLNLLKLPPEEDEPASPLLQ